MSSDTPLSTVAQHTPGTVSAIRKARQHAGFELWVIVLIALVAFFAAVRFNFMESFVAWSAQHEDWQLDETFSLFVVGTVAMAVFAVRRWRESLNNMSEQHQALARLRASERRLEQLFESSPFPVLVVSAKDGTILACNDEFERVTGHAPSAVLGLLTSAIALWVYPELAITLRARVRRDGQVRNESIEFQTANGDVRQALYSAELIEFGGRTAILGAFNDITDRRNLESQLAHQAFHDALTTLPNRALFGLRLEHALMRAPRIGSSPTVLFLDLDDFKRVNDTHGHAIGDELLIAVSRRLQTCLRTEDTCARLGGDEFAILLEDTISADDAVRLAERIVPTLQAPYELSGTVAHVGVSIGIAVADANITEQDMLRNADIAMYLSKSSGKGRFTVFDSSMHAEVVDRLALESDLLLALDRGEFFLQYQPIVTIASGEILGVEALVRWKHPTRGILPPALFIPIAETNGLIIELGAWVLRESCRTMRRMQLQHPRANLLRVSVNLSGRQIAHPDIVQQVSNALRDTGLDASSLILEITETVLVHNEADAVERLHALKHLGVRIAIDDFGTGYSSLAYLQRFPVDILKIDKSFTDRLGSGVEESAIARAVVALGNSINIQTIAEGIETLQQWERLRELGCELGQGYYLARPEDAATLNTPLTDQDGPVSALAFAA